MTVYEIQQARKHAAEIRGERDWLTVRDAILAARIADTFGDTGRVEAAK